MKEKTGILERHGRSEIWHDGRLVGSARGRDELERLLLELEPAIVVDVLLHPERQGTR